MPEGPPILRDAEGSLQGANLLLREGLYRDAVSRAYYAMFFAARALLSTEGLHPKSHGGVIQALGERFVKTGILDAETAGHLGFGLQSRQRADYSDLGVTADDARAAVRRAAEFVSGVAVIMRRRER